MIAYTTPTTTTDHIVGMRFGYTPANVATLGANMFTGTQTAPAFVGDGSGLTNLPAPSNVATLGANTFTGTQTAPHFAGDGSGLTNLPPPANVATLGPNTFTGTQTINNQINLRDPLGIPSTYVLRSGSGRFTLAGSNSFQSRMAIDPQGNVGINQDTPGAKLDVLSDLGGTAIRGTANPADPSGYAGYFDGGVRITSGVQIGGGLGVADGLTVGRGLAVNGNGMKHQRAAFSIIAGCTNGGVTWFSPFADANYTAIVSLEVTSDNFDPITVWVTSRTASGVSLRFCNNAQFASAASGFVHVLAIHDY